MIRVSGLKTCDACRKAMKVLQEDGLEADLRDVGKVPPTRDELQRWLDRFGDALVNRKSRTWREMTEAERAGEPVEMLLARPSLMKRPVIETAQGAFLGWNDEIRADLVKLSA